jgi:hypothetical protein
MFACDVNAESGWLAETFKTADESAAQEGVGQCKIRQLTTDEYLDKWELHWQPVIPQHQVTFQVQTGV